MSRPIVIAHRGASGYVPEHTLAAYVVAMLQGADYIEPDLVMTRDGELIARHDNRLDLTTDVASHIDYAARRTTKTVDGDTITGWFSEDFTLDEIRTLRTVERIPELRPANGRFDRQFGVPTLREILDLIRANEPTLGRRIGIYPEIKHPAYFARIGLPMEQALIAVLRAYGYTDRERPIFVQSFDPRSLRALRALCGLPLVQLLDVAGTPAGEPESTYDALATAAGLKRIAEYADAVGPNKERIIARDAHERLALRPTEFVRDAHAAGLLVHAYTFRAENRFLPLEFRRGNAPAAWGDLAGELQTHFAAGIDGAFVDHAPIGVQARDHFARDS